MIKYNNNKNNIIHRIVLLLLSLVGKKPVGTTHLEADYNSIPYQYQNIRLISKNKHIILFIIISTPISIYRFDNFKKKTIYKSLGRRI